MIRTFQGVQTLGAASQPVFGTTTTAASTMKLDQHTLSTAPASQDSVSTITVTDATGFRKSDRVLIGPEANFVFQGVLDQGTVIGVDTQNNILTVRGLLNPHGAGEYVVLNEDASAVIIKNLATNTDVMYLGNASTVSPTDSSVYDVIAAGGEHVSATTDTGNSYKTSDYWIFGTANDTFTARYTQV
jgi:hypothetical protein